MIAPPQVPLAPVKLEDILMRAWRLFRANVITALPFAVLTFTIVAIISLLFACFAVLLAAQVAAHGAQAGTSRADSVPAGVISAAVGIWLAAVVGGCFLQVWVYAVIFGLANAQWTTGSATLADGFAAGSKRFGAVFMAGIGFVGLAFAALFLALPTLFLSFIALILFTMYILPAAVGGERPGFAAIRESFELVRHAFGISAIALLILWAIQQATSFIVVPFLMPLYVGLFVSAARNDPTPHVATWQIAIAGGGYVVALGASCAFLGYCALVQTGLYHALRARQEALVVTTGVPAVPQP